MGLLDSFACMCPCITRQKPPISPGDISHPYPLIPKPPHPHAGTSSKRERSRYLSETPTFRPVSQVRSNYQPLHSPAPSSSDSTPQSHQRARPSRLGLGIDHGVYSLRPPDRVYLADKERIRNSIRSVNGSGSGMSGVGDEGRGSSSSRSRRLQKKRIVEGDWELVRRDVDPEGVSQGWTNIEHEGEEGTGQRRGGREET